MERDSEYYTKAATRRNFRKADQILGGAADDLALPDAVVEQSKAIYRRSRQENMLHGRSIKSMVAAAINVASERENVPIAVDEISDSIGIDRNTVLNASRQIKQEFGFDVGVPNYEEYIKRICEDLNLPDAVEPKALEISNYCQQQGLASGKEGAGFAAGSVYAAAKILPNSTIKTRTDLTQKQLEDVVSTTHVTIRNRYKEQLRAYQGLHEDQPEELDEAVGDTDATLGKPQLYLIPVSDDWYDEFHRTVEQELNIDDESAPDELKNKGTIRIWGTTTSDSERKTQHAEEIKEGDYVLFYRNSEFISGAVVENTWRGSHLGKYLWNSPESMYVFSLRDYTETVPPATEIFQILDYDQNRVQGFLRVSEDRLDGIYAKYGSISNILISEETDFGGYTSEAIDPDESVPDLRRPKSIETTISRKIRNTSLVKDLKESHNYECQVCGAQLRGNGEPYAEGHHIHPLGDTPGGPDIPENILILCPNHHSDFDYGQIAVDPDTMEIEHNYDDEFDGEKLAIVDDHEIAAKYLQYHLDNISQV